MLILPKNKFAAEDFGVTVYEEAVILQKRILQKRKSGLIPDTLIFVEHPHTITIGRRGLRENILAGDSLLKENGVAVAETDRGGDVHYHGPGQMVVWPVFDLRAHKKDVHFYIRNLEEVIIRLLAEYGISAERIKGLTGVWVNGEKIASIGVGVSRWVTYHGLALNVSTDLRFFEFINPCGMKAVRMTSIAECGIGDSGNSLPPFGERVGVRGVGCEIKDKIIEKFCEVFEF